MNEEYVYEKFGDIFDPEGDILLPVFEIEKVFTCKYTIEEVDEDALWDWTHFSDGDGNIYKYSDIIDEDEEVPIPEIPLVENTYTGDIQGYIEEKCGLEWLIEAEFKIDRLYMKGLIDVC